MVAKRAMVSLAILRMSAAVGEEEASPTPRPSRTARLARSEEMLLKKACRES